MKTRPKSKPSNGKKLRLIRVLGGKYAVNVKDVAKLMRVRIRQARYYISVLTKEGKIYVRYKQDRYNYYALRRGK
jgi:predicted transcriptional regulator of viral defense system